MLEKLPDAIGHALRDQRAGLDKLAMERTPLRSGLGALTVTSLAFKDHAPIPARYTADGEGASPPLQWRGVPATAQSLVLIVEDADAPTPQPLVHAIVVQLAPADGGVPEGALSDALPDALSEEEPAPPTPTASDASDLQLGRNSFLQTRWLPPDPPPGHGVHRYAFQLFALNAAPDFSAKPGRDEVMQALADHAIASGCLIGTYERPDGSQKVGAESADRTAETPMLEPVIGGVPAV